MNDLNKFGSNILSIIYVCISRCIMYILYTLLFISIVIILLDWDLLKYMVTGEAVITLQRFIFCLLLATPFNNIFLLPVGGFYSLLKKGQNKNNYYIYAPNFLAY